MMVGTDENYDALTSDEKELLETWHDSMALILFTILAESQRF